jgi:arylsulfatase A-like enzyme
MFYAQDKELLTSLTVHQIKLTYLLFAILTNQYCYDMISAMGNSQVKTPNIDLLAKDGIIQNSVSIYPVSSSMRGMLLTGMHPLYNRAWKNDMPYYYQKKLKLLKKSLKNIIIVQAA